MQQHVISTDTYDHWSWVEASVWTKTMLAALDNGVKDTYFANQGLFSLKEAHVMACQSRCGNS